MTVHRLDPGVGTVTDIFSRDVAPALIVDPGDTIIVRSLDAFGYLARPSSLDEPGDSLLDPPRGHCLTGPIAVRGAAPPALLQVDLISFQPDAWGWMQAGRRTTELTSRLGIDESKSASLVWDIDAEQGTATNCFGHRVAIAPFLGTIGLPPSAPGEYSTLPPRSEGGGNLDCRDLVPGSTLYLPITVPGGLLCVGDGHAAQGNGEVGGTAIECGMTSELRVDVVVDPPPVPGIHAVTPGGRITFGLSEDLDEAMVQALDAIVTWIEALHGVARGVALGLASAVVDLRVTQVANDVWGVHAVLPSDAIS